LTIGLARFIGWLVRPGDEPGRFVEKQVNKSILDGERCA
jgi:hypothetical protein